MTREEAKELLPIIQAYAEGKAIEHSSDGRRWFETCYPSWNPNLIYHIKPESKYRQFKNQEECWNEMLKHQPFGWIRIPKGALLCLYGVFDEGVSYKHSTCYFKECLDGNYTFADGTPFGIKEE